MSWICVTGKPAYGAFHDLGFRQTGGRVHGFVGDPVGRRRSDGSCLVIWFDDRAQLIEPARLRKVSLGADVVACHLHEGVMHSFASGWRDGAEAWSVEHASDRGRMDLAVSGAPPPIFPNIRDEHFARQTNAPPGRFQADHIWDIPFELCRHLAGFRHDLADRAHADPPYEVLTACDPEPSA